MALPITPAGVKAQRKLAIGWAPSIAGANGPTVAEVTVTITCDIIGEQGLTAEQTKGNPPMRLCEDQKYELLGATTYSIPDLKYVVDPQNPSDTNYKAFLTLTAGTSGFLVFRYGLDAKSVDWVAAQKVDVAPVTLGTQVKDAVNPTEEFELLSIMQKVAVTGPVRIGVAIA